MIECWAIISGDTIKSPVNMVSVQNGIVDFHTLSIEEYNKLGWYKCELYNEIYDGRLYHRSYSPISFFDSTKNKVISYYTLTPYTLEHIIETRCDEVDKLFEENYQTNIEVNVDDFTNVIQFRNDVDKFSIIVSMQTATVNILNGESSKLVGYRTIDNITNYITSDTFLKITTFIFDNKYKLLEILQKHKDNLRQLKNAEDVINYDIYDLWA